MLVRKSLLMITMGLICISLISQIVGCTGKERPNIVFIMTDQQSATMMSCTGNKWLETPALDRLAESGVRFERAYASNPICAPSRFSLQSGLMPSAIGMSSNEDVKNAAVTNKMISESLGNLFNNAGYETVYGGKVHLPHKMLDLNSKGEQLKPHQIQELAKIGYQKFLTRDSRKDLAEACANFIKGKHEKPFLLFASFINPHDICYMGKNDYRRSIGKPPENNPHSMAFEKVYDQIRDKKDLDAFIENHCPPLPENYAIADEEPEVITSKWHITSSYQFYLRPNWSEKEWRLHRWVYCRLTEAVDTKIGQVLKAIKEAGLEENTIIVFTSDHGDMDASHQLDQKSYLYEESIRIPFLFSYKGVVPAGVVDTTHLVYNSLDLLPTLCDFAGIKVPEGLPGSSFKSLVDGSSDPEWRDHIVVEATFGRMVRTDRYKYSIFDSGEHRIQLIDLKNDPGEMHNLATDDNYHEILEEHHWLLKKWIEKIDDKIAAQYVN